MTTFKVLQKTSRRDAPLIAVLVVIFLFSALAGVASANEPWWHLVSLSRPSYMRAEAGANEVQELNIPLASVFQLDVNSNVIGKFLYIETIPSAAELQTALEAPAGYGVGNVKVSGGPAATGTGILEPDSTEVTEVVASSGAFVKGQEIYGINIPRGTTIEKVEKTGVGTTLTLSQITGSQAGKSNGPISLVAGDAPFRVTSTHPGSVPPLELPFASPEDSTMVLSEGKPDGEIFVTAANHGNATVDGETSPVTLTDVLPAGLRAVSISAHVPKGYAVNESVPIACSLEKLTCTVEGTYEVNADGTHEVLPKAVPPFSQIEMRIGVVLEGAKTGEENRVSISGGGAPPAAAERSIRIGETPVPYGVEGYEMVNEEVGGVPTTQAGKHPFQTTFTTVLNTSGVGPSKTGQKLSVQMPAFTKDLLYKLPAGWVGNPQPFERCALAQFYIQQCPPKSIIGVTSTTVYEPNLVGLGDLVVPLYNLEPAPGEAARFGFFPLKTPVFLDSSVRAGEDYGVTTRVENITQVAALLASEVTVWGVPGESSHDEQRGTGCLLQARGATLQQVLQFEEHPAPCHPLEEPQPPAFLSVPASCPTNPATGAPEPMFSSLETDSWRQPGQFTATAGAEGLPALDGCNRLPFKPSISASPDVDEGSKPTGLTVDVHVPQEESLNAGGLMEAEPRNITVTLPEGVAINPAGGDGLEACSEGLVGFKGAGEFKTDPGVSVPLFRSQLPGSFGDEEELEPGSNFCTNASKIGTAEIDTPLLKHPVKGFVYLAAQEANPFGSLVAIYLVAEEPEAGVLVELAGEVELGNGANGLAPGQIRTTFDNSPQAPFEDAVLHFFGGERAPLVTPSYCRENNAAYPGTYATTAAFLPWSSAKPVTETSTFNIDSGPDGKPCPGQSLPFNPSLTAGTTNINAGGFSPLTMTMSREDGDQQLNAIELKTPPGLSGLLEGVELCPEPQASQGACGPGSLIGETTVSVGLGGDPFTVKGGKVYITGPYEGAPFGLSIVNPAKAGPFDLEDTKARKPACDCLLVRAKIEVNPITAALTVTSNTAAQGDSIPTMLEGIPLQIKHVNVTINRPGFTFNPTSCEKMEISGELSAAEGATQALSVPFQATNCAVLGFAPKFSASTSAHTSRADGASLSVKLTYPQAPFGSQANIKQVKVELPKGLPSRLSTLQKACTAAQFHANPAGCPAASLIGHAKAITPLVPVPLEGPAYFVSNGGEAFPNLIIVLQGYGVTIDLVGDTFISKAGVTSSTFKTVPDAPVGSFELNLPEGPYSALTADGSLCTQTLTMPTEFLAQNGAQIKTNTKIAVQGCGKVKKAHRKAKKAHHKRKKDHSKKKHN
jgi:hypothetical protein